VALVPDGFIAGIDASEEMVRMATRRCRPLVDAGRVGLMLADSASIPYAAGSFDGAYAVHTIYFWPEPARDLRELSRVLRDGGRLVLGFHANRETAASAFPASVYTFYDAGEVRELLERTGFVDVEIGCATADVALAIARNRRARSS
jgi:ubiquinone/menaquinone biosynthesis C-methylase UbiE